MQIAFGAVQIAGIAQRALLVAALIECVHADATVARAQGSLQCLDQPAAVGAVQAQPILDHGQQPRFLAVNAHIAELLEFGAQLCELHLGWQRHREADQQARLRQVSQRRG